VIDKKILAKVQRAYYCKTRTKRPSGKVYNYRVWWGFWYEDGQPKKVYLGRELPGEVKELIKKRELSRGGSQYFWPKSRHGKLRGDLGVVQVRGN